MSEPTLFKPGEKVRMDDPRLQGLYYGRGIGEMLTDIHQQHTDLHNRLLSQAEVWRSAFPSPPPSLRDRWAARVRGWRYALARVIAGDEWPDAD